MVKNAAQVFQLNKDGEHRCVVACHRMTRLGVAACHRMTRLGVVACHRMTRLGVAACHWMTRLGVACLPGKIA